MQRVYLNLGSNIDPAAHLRAGLNELDQAYGVQGLSSAYESAAIGFDGPAFLNMAVALDVSCTLAELAPALRDIEYAYGRPRNSTRFSSRTLDIDILTFADTVGTVVGVELPRPEILYNAFVLWPLAELAPEQVHPVEQRSYAQLWAVFDQSSQAIMPVEFEWRPRAGLKSG